jgi:hypothetical protein
MSVDSERDAATALVKACSGLLEAQRLSQPECYPQIRKGVLEAVELRFEVTVTMGSRATNVRITTIDGHGCETMLVRALDLTPPPPGALQ